MEKRVLIADDEMISTEILRDSLSAQGFSVLTAGNGQEAWELLKSNTFDIALLDIKMPFRTGIELIRKVKKTSPGCVVIIMTAFSSIETAVTAIKTGADDFLPKPFDLDILIGKLLQITQEKAAPPPAAEPAALEESESLIIGQSPAVQAIRAKIEKVKNVSSTILITGESGTGKSFIAREIHNLSKKEDAPFILVDCASLPATLIESELFGHERGAFTGAVTRKPGKFEQAEKGTIFLDEISCLPLPLQSRLLTVLQERSYTRVGGSEKINMEARILAATNENLERAVALGTFRPDLYYRLNVVNIEVPPLRFRKDDIPPLARHFISRLSRSMGKPTLSVDDSFFEDLSAYDWPGNVRELENAIESAILLCDGSALSSEDLPLRIVNRTGGQRMKRVQKSPTLLSDEKAALLTALEKCGGHREKTAQLLGISRRTLQYKLKKWHLV